MTGRQYSQTTRCWVQVLLFFSRFFSPVASLPSSSLSLYFPAISVKKMDHSRPREKKTCCCTNQLKSRDTYLTTLRANTAKRNRIYLLPICLSLYLSTYQNPYDSIHSLHQLSLHLHHVSFLSFLSSSSFLLSRVRLKDKKNPAASSSSLSSPSGNGSLRFNEEAQSV